MTETLINHPRFERTTDSVDRLAMLKWSAARDTVKELSGELEHNHLLDNSDKRPISRQSQDYAEALSLYAKDFCQSAEAPVEQSEIDKINLLATIPLYLHHQKRMAQLQATRNNGRMSKDHWNEFKELKRATVEYNQLLSDYAYTNPDDTLMAFQKSLIEQAIPSFPQEIDIVERHVKQATRGARTEAAARDLIDRTPITYTPGTIEDDLRGGDLIIQYNGKRIKIDIKSSLDDIANIRGGYDEISEKNLAYAIKKRASDHGDSEKHVVVLFPGFIDADMKGSLGLALPEDEKQDRAFKLSIQLQRAIRELGI